MSVDNEHHRKFGLSEPGCRESRDEETSPKEASVLGRDLKVRNKKEELVK